MKTDLFHGMLCTGRWRGGQRWFNLNHEELIEEFKLESKSEGDKRRYNNQPEVIQKREAKQHAINFAIEMKGQGLSGREIAEELTTMNYPTKKNTVNDWLRKQPD